MSKLMKALAAITWIIGFILGIMCGTVETGRYTEFIFSIALIYWAAAFVSGALLFSIGVHLENQETMMDDLHEVKTALLRELSVAESERKKVADEEKRINAEVAAKQKELEAQAIKQKQLEEKAARDAYWAEHAEEKIRLEAEKESLAAETKALISTVSNHPGDKRRLALWDQVRALREEVSSLGSFKKAEKLSLEQKISELKQEAERVAAETDSEKAKLRQEIKSKQDRLAEINKQLPPDDEALSQQKTSVWSKY